ncbi:hypothetical protein EJ05DRAFT_502184 [Pseudovirgaria hyperparasitica]|uniref:Uncharacterized protein n=1 Tax=Pseudovirgaria hyperparasitica TaxID=470096 RepID=A0A6A6W193_9PEZI|nr:uncharacterized protein EJ05DRAFT_502184 [Pseudovirgaria hyperparasitica]KAF2756688.1 hypothetical protein EJ05DRAFT_502184 [Pseudovirgaria hyperparasitica]
MHPECPSTLSSPSKNEPPPSKSPTTPHLRTSFLSLPLELREQVYAHLFSDSPGWAGETKIELSDEQGSSGDPVDICLKLHWYWFLANRQIAREGVEYGFRWTKVRFVGGPWVLRALFEKIKTPWLRRPLTPEQRIAWAQCSPLPSSLDKIVGDGAYALCSNPNPPPSLEPNRLALLRHLELAWTTIPHDIGSASVLARISSFELRPLFTLIAHDMPSLECITTSLRFRSRRDTRDGGLTRAEWFNVELASYALALLLCAHSPHSPTTPHFRTLRIRYMARNPWAAMEPPLALPLVTSSPLFTHLRAERLPELAAVLTGVRAWGFCVSEDTLAVASSVVPWDPMRDTHMVGEEVEFVVRVREGCEVRDLCVPDGGMGALGRRKGWGVGVGVYGGGGGEEEVGEGEGEAWWEDEVDWTGLEDREAYGRFLRDGYCREYRPWEGLSDDSDYGLGYGDNDDYGAAMDDETDVRWGS